MDIKVLVSVLFLIISVAFAKESDVEIGENATFVSPDGRFTAMGYVRIKDNKSGKTSGIAVLGPIYSMEWTGDSRTLLVVSHIAGGKTAILIHYKNGVWTKFDADPPNENKDAYFDYSLVGQKVEFDSVKLTYRIKTRNSLSQLAENSLCVFTVDPKTNTYSKVENGAAKPE